MGGKRIKECTESITETVDTMCTTIGFYASVQKAVDIERIGVMPMYVYQT